MRYFITAALFFIASFLWGQSPIVGSGIPHTVDGDPSGNRDLENLDLNYQSGITYDSVSRRAFIHNPNQPFGRHWYPAQPVLRESISTATHFSIVDANEDTVHLRHNFALASETSKSNYIYVSPEGDNITAIKGSRSLSFRDPWTARDSAVAGDVIYVLPGYYDLGDVKGDALYKVPPSDYTPAGDAWGNHFMNANLGFTDGTLYLSKGATLEVVDFAGMPLVIGTPNFPLNNFHVRGEGRLICKSDFATLFYLNSFDRSADNITIEADYVDHGRFAGIISNCNFSFDVDTLAGNGLESFLFGGGDEPTVDTSTYIDMRIEWLLSQMNPVQTNRVRPFTLDGFGENHVYRHNINIDIKNLIGNNSQVFCITAGNKCNMRQNTVNVTVHNQKTTEFSPVTVGNAGAGWLTWGGASAMDAVAIFTDNTFNFECKSCDIEQSIYGGSVGKKLATQMENNVINIRGNFILRGSGEEAASVDSPGRLFVYSGSNYAVDSDGTVPRFVRTNIDVNVKTYGNCGIYRGFEDAKSLGTVTLSGVFDYSSPTFITNPELFDTDTSNDYINVNGATIFIWKSEDALLNVGTSFTNGSKIRFTNVVTNSTIPITFGVTTPGGPAGPAIPDLQPSFSTNANVLGTLIQDGSMN